MFYYLLLCLGFLLRFAMFPENAPDMRSVIIPDLSRVCSCAFPATFLLFSAAYLDVLSVFCYVLLWFAMFLIWIAIMFVVFCYDFALCCYVFTMVLL